MIQLPRWVLTSKNPSFYDTESVTSVEMVAKLYAAMQTLIDEYNTFAESTEKTINDFMSDESANRNVFEIAMQQKFQDFIDVVELRLQKIEVDTVAYSKQIVNDAIQSGLLRITEVYNPETESLDMIIDGGV